MALLGTNVARKVLNIHRMSCYRIYTQKRVNDRSYKIYGRYTADQLEQLVYTLNAFGAQNIRPVPSIVGTGNAGIRFEM